MFFDEDILNPIITKQNYIYVLISISLYMLKLFILRYRGICYKKPEGVNVCFLRAFDNNYRVVNEIFNLTQLFKVQVWKEYNA